MKGTVHKRITRKGATVWAFQLDLPTGEDGKRRRVTKSGFRRRSDAQDALDEEKRIRSLPASEPAPDPAAGITFADLMTRWLDEQGPRRCQPKTLERYRQLSTYIVREIGDKPLSQVRTFMLEMAFNRLRESGGKEGRPLSITTVGHIAGLVRVALKAAVRWELIENNPAREVELPTIGARREPKALDFGQTERLLAKLKGHWLYPISVLAAATGCRRGELLALTWSDVDFFDRVVWISKSLEQTEAGLRIKLTKSEKPRRIGLSPFAMEALRDQKRTQEGFREMFGKDYGPGNLVFTTPTGGYLAPDSVTAKFCLMAGKLGFKGVSLHSLRHSHASQLLSAGVKLPVVSKRLGHASPQVTSRIYSHALEPDEIAAGNTWEIEYQKASREAAEKARAERSAAHGSASDTVSDVSDNK